MPATLVKRTFPVQVEVQGDEHFVPGRLESSDTTDYTDDMYERFEKVKRLVVECCGSKGQTRTFEQRLRELYAA